MPNRLARETSPYLRQHADNPIDWYPWCDEAFDRAKELDRPILLSVGYSSCHWCHVMAHESFENPEVGGLLDASFISIKVDREERPDVDDAYMTAVQLASGRGGWPMTLFLTPDRKPFFAGTYLPLEDRGGHPGLISVLRGITQGWRDSRREFMEAADEFGQAIEATFAREAPPASGLDSTSLVRRALETLAHDFDPRNAGFGGAPKFPPHTGIELLMAIADCDRFDQNERVHARHMAEATLLAMAAGGIHDHVGGGFHRYATDAEWGLPHFEKMLVDNALLLATYGGLGNLASPIVERLVAFLEREMRGDSGLYATALDADSDGVEGAFYVWRWDEVRALLGERAEPFFEAYGFAPNGNFADEALGVRTGANVLQAVPSWEELARIEREFAHERSILLDARSRRPRPQTDDKALIEPNGLLLAGFCAAGKVELARRLGTALLDVVELPSVPRQILDGRPVGLGFLNDYAALGYGLARLAERDPEGPWGLAARRVAAALIEKFGDGERGGFYGTSLHHEHLFGRTKPPFDQPGPSGNALACRLLLHTGHTDEASRALTALRGWLERAPTATEALHLALLESLERLPEASAVRLDQWDGQAGQFTLELRPGYHLQPGSLRVTSDGDVPFELLESVEPNKVILSFSSPEPLERLWIAWQSCTDTECLPEETATLELPSPNDVS